MFIEPEQPHLELVVRPEDKIIQQQVFDALNKLENCPIRGTQESALFMKEALREDVQIIIRYGTSTGKYLLDKLPVTNILYRKTEGEVQLLLGIDASMLYETTSDTSAQDVLAGDLACTSFLFRLWNQVPLHAGHPLLQTVSSLAKKSLEQQKTYARFLEKQGKRTNDIFPYGDPRYTNEQEELQRRIDTSLYFTDFSFFHLMTVAEKRLAMPQENLSDEQIALLRKIKRGDPDQEILRRFIVYRTFESLDTLKIVLDRDEVKEVGIIALLLQEGRIKDRSEYMRADSNKKIFWNFLYHLKIKDQPALALDQFTPDQRARFAAEAVLENKFLAV